MSEYVVVDEPCYEAFVGGTPSAETCEELALWNNGLRCRGCLGNGRSVLLDTATPVERRATFDDPRPFPPSIYVPLGDSGDTETEQEQP